MGTTWKCTSCGAIDSRILGPDNFCCSECGDTEGLEEVSYGIGVVEYSGDPDRLFDRDALEEAIFEPGQLGSPGLFEVGLIHWLAHKFGWNSGRVITWFEPDREALLVGFKCDRCGTIGGVHEAGPGDPDHSESRLDWDSIWQMHDEPEYIKSMKKLPPEERRKMIMGDPTVDLPDYCVCRVPERPLIDGTWCRECQGKLVEVVVRDLSNYGHGLPDEVPFEGRVIGRSDDSEPEMCWVQSIKTGKQYELYNWQFDDKEAE